MHVRDATVGPLSGTRAVSAASTSTPLVRNAERVRDDLRVHRARALADLGAARRGCGLRVSVSSSAAFDASFTSPPPVNPEPWKKSDSPMPAVRAPRTRAACARKPRAPHRLAQHRRARCESRPSLWPVAVVSPGPQRVDLAQAHGIDAERLGDPLHVHFDGELRLRRAEPAERAVRRRVRHDGAAADAHVIAAVRAGRVDDAAREHDRRQRAVRAAVEERRRSSIAVRRPSRVTPVRCRIDRRVPLRRRDHVLDAVVDELDRPPRLQREQRARARRSSTGTPPCRRIRRRSRSGRRAPSRRAARAAPRAPDARSRGTGASRRR